MKLTVILILVSALALMALLPTASAKKKAKKSKKVKEGPFDSKTLKCLVCKAVVSEFEAAIFKVDPKKVIDSGSYRVKPDGTQNTDKVAYARSQTHLMELSEKLCDNMEDYAQATWKKDGKPTLIRMVKPDGNMNPDFGKVDVIKDDDLNSSLKFHVRFRRFKTSWFSFKSLKVTILSFLPVAISRKKRRKTITVSFSNYFEDL